MKSKIFINQKRNNYYHGKLLTEKDFVLDQDYFNSKRRMINKFIFGHGIVKGLEIIRLDSENLCLEPGIAIDYYGRELIVPSPLVFKIEDIENYTYSNNYSDILLYLDYDEKFESQEDSIGDYHGKNSNFIIEGTNLKIVEYSDDYRCSSIESYVSNYKTIFSSRDVEVLIKTPKFIKASENMFIEILVKKVKEETEVDLEIGFDLKYLYTENMESSLNYKYKVTNKSHIEKINLIAESTNDIEARLYIREKDTMITVNGEKYGVNGDIDVNVDIVGKEYIEEISKRYYEKGILESIDEGICDKLFLSRLSIKYDDKKVKVEGLTNNPFDQKIMNMDMLNLISRAPDKFKVKHISTNNNTNQGEKEESQSNDYNSNSGELTVDLSINPRKHQTYYSPEISHDLGVGIVDIRVGLKNEIAGEKVIIYGINHNILGSIPEHELSIILYPEKGTFKVAVTLKETSKVKEINFSWNCNKIGKRVVDSMKEPNLIISPNSAIISPNQEFIFKGRIENYDNQEILWSIVDVDGGKISESGYYIAPDKVGVYKVEAYSIVNHNIKGTAYVVVKH